MQQLMQFLILCEINDMIHESPVPAVPVMPRLNCKIAKTQQRRENKGQQGQS